MSGVPTLQIVGELNNNVFLKDALTNFLSIIKEKFDLYQFKIGEEETKDLNRAAFLTAWESEKMNKAYRSVYAYISVKSSKDKLSKYLQLNEIYLCEDHFSLNFAYFSADEYLIDALRQILDNRVLNPRPPILEQNEEFEAMHVYLSDLKNRKNNFPKNIEDFLVLLEDLLKSLYSICGRNVSFVRYE